jgi:hypothetical protein
MVLGDDIGMEDSVSLALCTLLGRISYRHLCRIELADWVHSIGNPLLGYSPEISYLPRGWYSFNFATAEDALLILERLWVFDRATLMMKHWRVSFDPQQDYFRHRHTWVLLPSLPLHLSNTKALQAIGNSLGRFISVDSVALAAPVKRVAKVLVELDIHEGVLESIDIEWRGHNTRQKLDYLGIPFRCTLCRQTGHLGKSCTGLVEEEKSEDSMLELSTRLGSPEVNTLPTYPGIPEAEDSVDLDSISGKLRQVNPSLYNTLTNWEIEQLDAHTSPHLREDTTLPETSTCNPPSSHIPPTSHTAPNTTLCPPKSTPEQTSSTAFSETFLASDGPILAHTHPTHTTPPSPNPTPTPPLSGTLEENNYLPPCDSDTGTSSLGDVLHSLLPSYREVLTPIPLPIYRGSSSSRPLSSGEQLDPSEAQNPATNTTYTWSKGQGLVHSPIKTRSARKKDGPSSHPDTGALRVKALARAKP